jgi:hypothetical protein
MIPANRTSTMGALQTCATLAGVALALGAILSDRDGQMSVLLDMVTFAILISGLVAILGCAFALVDLCTECDLQVSKLVGLKRSTNTCHEMVLVSLFWAIVVLAVAHIGLIAHTILTA